MVYLFIYSDDMGNRETVKALLNSIPQITNWRYDLPNAFYIESVKSADELADLIIERRPNTRFFITEISKSNKQGWLPKDTWTFLNKE